MKKIFFIHIAKTAGSAFNLFLKKNFVGEAHCERYLIPNTNKFSKIEHLKSLDYVSGHLIFPVFQENNFSKKDYFLLAFLREPVSQLISHLNWVMHIKDIDLKFFNGHPDNIKSMCLELRESNLYHTDTLIEKLNKFKGLFKNSQSRYFINNPNNISTESVLDNMLLLDMVGITEQYQTSLEKFILLNKLEINPTVEIVNKNFSYKVEHDLLDNKVIYDFLTEYLAVDMEIYKYFVADNAITQNLTMDEQSKEILEKQQGTKVAGHLDKAEGQLISGWARYLHKKEPATVIIFVNDEWVGTATCQIPRVDLEKKFGQACAFKFVLPAEKALKTGDKVAVLVEHEANHINNSPFIVTTQPASFYR